MFLDGWMDGSKSRLKDCLQQSTMFGLIKKVFFRIILLSERLF
jgi:hypothetical protein